MSLIHSLEKELIHSLENERSAIILGRFAAFCSDFLSICSVLHRFGAILLRSASISGHFAASCIDLEPFCSVLHRFGAHILENELIL